MWAAQRCHLMIQLRLAELLGVIWLWWHCGLAPGPVVTWCGGLRLLPRWVWYLCHERVCQIWVIFLKHCWVLCFSYLCKIFWIIFATHCVWERDWSLHHVLNWIRASELRLRCHRDWLWVRVAAALCIVWVLFYDACLLLEGVRNVLAWVSPPWLLLDSDLWCSFQCRLALLSALLSQRWYGQVSDQTPLRRFDYLLWCGSLEPVHSFLRRLHGGSPLFDLSLQVVPVANELLELIHNTGPKLDTLCELITHLFIFSLFIEILNHFDLLLLPECTFVPQDLVSIFRGYLEFRVVGIVLLIEWKFVHIWRK